MLSKIQNGKPLTILVLMLLICVASINPNEVYSQKESNGINSLEISPMGDKLLIVDTSGRIEVREIISMEFNFELSYFADSTEIFPYSWHIHSLAWTLDSQYVGIAFYPNRVSVWDLHNQQIIFSEQTTEFLYSDPPITTTVWFSDDGKRISTLGDNGLWRVWDIASSDLILSQQLTEASIPAVDLSPDFSFFIYADVNGNMYTVDTSDLLAIN